MPADWLRKLFSQLGFKLQGVAEIRFGRGVTSKTTTALIFAVVGIVTMGVFASDGPYTAVIVIIIAILLCIYFIGTWVHTARVPHEALEGAHLKAHLSELAAKHENTIDGESKVIRNPQALAIESAQGVGEDDE